MNKAQIIGIGIGAIGIAAYFLTENNIIHTISGVVCAIGLAYVLKLLPIKKRN
tara:strand:+ start:20454 stop:20612 length:159 start_codon:yes stop_codon:yes gene_type:complete